MSSPPRTSVVIAALVLLIALSLPRYVERVGASDYVRAAQMVALVWTGFFLSARYWVRGDARFSRALQIVAAAICIPALMYHLYAASGDTAHVGNLFLLMGIASYSYGALVLSERKKRMGR
jgi:hypothetical protein